MTSKDKFIIGFGTGRCGTKSLATLLSKQPSILATHEFTMLPWKFDPGMFIDVISQLRYHAGSKIPCDVGFYWINYLDKLIDLFPDTRAVCLVRNKENTVKSWVSNLEANFFTDKNSSKYVFFPDYDLLEREAITRYYDDYHKKLFKLYLKYPDNIRTFISPCVLNEEVLQSDMLSFVGIPESEQVISTGITANPSDNNWKKIPNMLMYNYDSGKFKTLKEAFNG